MKAQKQQFEHAKALHQAGQLRKAESIYMYLLEQDASDVDSLHYLGLLHADTDRTETSVQLLRAAIGIDGARPWLCRNLGIVLERRGDRSAAAACYRQALEEAPDDHEIWLALAAILSAENRHADAVPVWTRVIDTARGGQTRNIPYRLGLANSLALSGARRAAICEYEKLLALAPEHVEGNFHRAVAYMQEDDLVTAMDGFRRTLDLEPRHAKAANNLAILLQLGRRYSEAIQYYQKAIHEDRAFHAAIYNLGSAWQEFGHADRAIGVFRKVLRLQPEHAAAWTNLGNAWLARNKTQAAIECYRKTLLIDSGEAAAEWNIGIVSLLTGDLLNGWAGYERRFEVKGATPRRPFQSPLWRGEPLAGKKLLLHAEQGLGDTLQFIRYASVFAQQGAEVMVECQAALLPLLEGSSGVSKWFPAIGRPPGPGGAASVDHLPQADYQLPLMSAPAVTGTTLNSIPLANGYVEAPAAAVQKWKRWLGGRSSQLRVGLCWAGNPNHKNDRNRSIPAELLTALEPVSNVEWINLQKGVPIPSTLEMRNAARELRDFADTAGIIQNLDLVISVDTSVAHLAGALGKPVWVLIPFAPDWRWLLDRTDSPWYSRARLFRQAVSADWRSVLERVAEELAAMPVGKQDRVQGILKP